MRLAKVLTLGLVALSIAGPAKADTTAWVLALGDFAQDWSNAALITTNDNWSGVPSITGYLGDTNAGSPTNVDPQTYLLPSLGAVDAIAQATNPNTLTAGGVAEFDTLTNPTVALNGSGTADTPGLVLFMNATNRLNVTISYDLIDLDGSVDNSTQQFALQYRIGGAGNFINVPAGYVADASAGPSQSGKVTPVSVSLAAWNGASDLQLRILTTNAGGNDEWVGIDNIKVTSVVPEPGSMVALATGLLGMAGLVSRKRR